MYSSALPDDAADDKITALIIEGSTVIFARTMAITHYDLLVKTFALKPPPKCVFNLAVRETGRPLQRRLPRPEGDEDRCKGRARLGPATLVCRRTECAR